MINMCFDISLAYKKEAEGIRCGFVGSQGQQEEKYLKRKKKLIID